MELQSEREQISQETTMARHGTMPEIMYERHRHISERVNVSGLAESPTSTASWAERLDEMPDCDRDLYTIT